MKCALLWLCQFHGAGGVKISRGKEDGGQRSGVGDQESGVRGQWVRGQWVRSGQCEVRITNNQGGGRNGGRSHFVTLLKGISHRATEITEREGTMLG